MRRLFVTVIWCWIIFIMVTSFNIVMKENVKFIKRKVALVGGYVGSNYYGLQMDPRQLNTPNFVPTVENELRVAMTKAGHILESNSLDLAKIYWSRSSRTDKGVHAARIVFSAKLELPETLVPQQTNEDDEPPRFPFVVQNTNQYLPPEIRLFSCLKVNSGFVARDECYWREYEYIFPLALLTENTASLTLTEQRSYVHQLNRFLHLFQGSHQFHNFHRIQRRDMPGKMTGPLYQQLTDPSSPFYSPAVERDMPPLDVETDPLDESEKEYSQYYFDDWKETKRATYAKTQGVIYRCHAELTNISTASSSSVPFVKVKLLGQYFLLNQIRLMISAAILSAKKILPEFFIPMSLTSPVFFRLPLAPSQGLVLTNAGFYGPEKGQRITMSSKTSTSPFLDWWLMSDPEYAVSEHFLTQQIYPRIAVDWQHNDSQLVSETLADYHRYALPTTQTTTLTAPSLASTILPVWSKIHAHYKTVQQNDEMTRRNRDYDRIKQSIKELKSIVKDVSKIEYLSAQQLMKLRKRFPHRLFLPNTLSTMLALRFETFPSQVINRVVQILATRLIRDNGASLPPPTEDLNTAFINRVEQEIEQLKLKTTSKYKGSSPVEAVDSKTTSKPVVKKPLRLEDLKLWIASQPSVSHLFAEADERRETFH